VKPSGYDEDGGVGSDGRGASDDGAGIGDDTIGDDDASEMVHS